MAIADVNVTTLAELDKIWEGSGVKLSVSIVAQGFDMSRDNFSLLFVCGVNELKVSKGDMLYDDDGTWYVALDTNKLGVGTVQMTVRALVPDADFAEGVRVEISKQNVFEIVS